MEILQAVRVRGERWRIADIRAYDDCQLVTLAGHGSTRRVLAPFDDVEPVAPNLRPHKVSARRWRRTCRAMLAADTPAGCLRTAAAARVDLLPYQLEPALAVIRGGGSRLLLADDVGLGKTIQAGLIVAELLARGCAERVLILTPAGVRDQWSAELRGRFGIAAAHADAASLRHLIATLPFGINPWHALPLAIASIDYVKRPEVLPAVRSVPWDVVVLDEAHASAGDSERRDAARIVTERAGYVVLLTATPHNGDDAAFRDLCRIGAASAVNDDGDARGDRLLVFRRTRQAVLGNRQRKIRVLRVRPRLAERQMYDALHTYRRAVAAEHGERALALAVLEKRAFSSPWSLAQSVDRRLATLGDATDASTVQLSLPLDDVDGEHTADDAPPPWPEALALADAGEDRRLLAALAAAARTAAASGESKLLILRRLLRRVGESALVFTEFRDSAVYLRGAVGRPALLLHGGMDRRERAAVVHAFTQTTGALLIATDAAGQGLNLHHACRLVINVELPWNPMRLEQRIGRVDRIGQTRTVHAIHLVASGTGETAILARLKARVAQAQSAIDAPDPLGGAPNDVAGAADAGVANGAARQEVERVTRARMLMGGRGEALAFPEDDRPIVLRARRRRLRVALAGRSLLIYRLTCDAADGRAAESHLVALMAPGRADLCEPPPVPREVVDAWHRSVVECATRFHDARRARQLAIASTLEREPVIPFQPALFDRRAERTHSSEQRDRTDAVGAAELRIAAIERQALIGEPVARLVLIAQP